VVFERLAVDYVVRELLNELRLECAEQFGILALFSSIALQRAGDDRAVSGGLGESGLLSQSGNTWKQEAAKEKVVEV
jgi:hypothetical protein